MRKFRKGSSKNRSRRRIYLQQDNNPKHTAKKTNKFFEDSNIKLLASTKSGLESNRKFIECIGFKSAIRKVKEQERLF